MPLRVVISAGEVSGDQHLGRVVESLRRLRPDAEVRGMGGPGCRAAGAELVVDCYKSGTAMGFLEIFRSLRGIFSSFSSMRGLIRQWKPQLVILVDYPDFNLRLAKVAREEGAKVLYYIPPKVWAWRSGRVERIRERVDHVATIFPFEAPWFRERGYQPVSYVGHPLTDQVREPGGPGQRGGDLLFMPGSRKFEIERMLVPMLKAFQRFRRERPGLRATVMLADNMSEAWARDQAAAAVSAETLQAIDWKKGHGIEEMRKARAAILKSGTCNLEGAIAGLPFVCVYSGTLLAKMIVSTFVRLKEYSPVNVMKPGTVRELIRVKHDEEELERELSRIYEEGPVRQKMIEDLGQVRDELFSFQHSTGDMDTVAGRVADLAAQLGAAQGRGAA